MWQTLMHFCLMIEMNHPEVISQLTKLLSSKHFICCSLLLQTHLQACESQGDLLSVLIMHNL